MGEGRTSDMMSRSFCAVCILVEPFGLRICFVSVLWRAANLGLAERMGSSIGGSIVCLLVAWLTGCDVGGEGVWVC